MLNYWLIDSFNHSNIHSFIHSLETDESSRASITPEIKLAKDFTHPSNLRSCNHPTKCISWCSINPMIYGNRGSRPSPKRTPFGNWWKSVHVPIHLIYSFGHHIAESHSYKPKYLYVNIISTLHWDVPSTRCIGYHGSVFFPTSSVVSSLASGPGHRNMGLTLSICWLKGGILRSLKGVIPRSWCCLRTLHVAILRQGQNKLWSWWCQKKGSEIRSWRGRNKSRWWKDRTFNVRTMEFLRGLWQYDSPVDIWMFKILKDQSWYCWKTHRGFWVP